MNYILPLIFIVTLANQSIFAQADKLDKKTMEEIDQFESQVEFCIKLQTASFDTKKHDALVKLLECDDIPNKYGKLNSKYITLKNMSAVKALDKVYFTKYTKPD